VTFFVRSRKRYGAIMIIKPIETIYKGYRFRSRLEARWAVFFDALGIEWEYEPEGFELGDLGWYLPDFYLPSLDMWAEVKPYQIDTGSLEWDKIEALVVGTQKRAVVLTSIKPVPKGTLYNGDFTYTAFFPQEQDEDRWASSDDCYMWCACCECGGIGLEYEGRENRLKCKECYACAAKKWGKEHLLDGFIVCQDCGKETGTGCGKCKRDKGRVLAGDYAIEAYKKALSARFEHGESG